MGPNPIMLMKGELWTQGEGHVMIGRDQGEVCISQGIPDFARKPAGTRKEAWNQFSLKVLRINPANTLILDFQPPDL